MYRENSKYVIFVILCNFQNMYVCTIFSSITFFLFSCCCCLFTMQLLLWVIIITYFLMARIFMGLVCPYVMPKRISIVFLLCIPKCHRGFVIYNFINVKVGSAAADDNGGEMMEFVTDIIPCCIKTKFSQSQCYASRSLVLAFAIFKSLKWKLGNFRYS